MVRKIFRAVGLGKVCSLMVSSLLDGSCDNCMFSSLAGNWNISMCAGSLNMMNEGMKPLTVNIFHSLNPQHSELTVKVCVHEEYTSSYSSITIHKYYFLILFPTVACKHECCLASSEIGQGTGAGDVPILS